MFLRGVLKAALVTVGCVLFVLGCTESNPSLGDGGSLADSGWKDSAASAKSCTSDKQCTGLGLVCDPLAKKCVQCLFDTDCEDDFRCHNFFCVPRHGCQNSLQCTQVKGKPICSKALGECVACETKADCGKNSECKNYSCVPYTPCTSSKQCPGQVCDRTAGKCVDCLTKADCGDGKLCQDNTCVSQRSCKSDKDCTPFGMLCDKPAGICRQCMEHPDCPEAYYCKDFKCLLDVCAQGQSKCQGNSVVNCTKVGNAYGTPRPCGSMFCVRSGTKASCQASPTPDTGVQPKDMGTPNEKGIVPRDRGVPADTTPTGCKPPGHAPITVQRLSAGDFAVALEAGFTYKPLPISGVKPQQALAVMDYKKGADLVAAFVVSRPSLGSKIDTAVTQVGTNLQKQISATFTISAAGSNTTSHDGFALRRQMVVSVKMASISDLATVRQQAASAILDLPASQIANWPATYGSGTTNFVLRLATLLRKDGRSIVVGAVTEAAADANGARAVRRIAEDLTDGSALSTATRTTAQVCDSVTVKMTKSNKVDIIWVVDESGSMNDNRLDIANNASTFFNAAKASGLDFRMGVTNVCNPKGSYTSAIGRFCSRASSNTNDSGGTDRFLLPSEVSIFSACIKNPPGYEGGVEHPLINAKKAVELHLPRAANSPSKIRTGAQLVIIVVTDEVDQEVKNTTGNNIGNKCTLSSAEAAKLDTVIKPYRAYFSGGTTAAAKVNFFQALGGVCSNSCQAQVTHDLASLAKSFRGKVYDVCKKNLATSINTIIGDIKVGVFTTPPKVTQNPVTSTLRVAVDGKTLSRGNPGFVLNSATKVLTITGTTLKNGSVVVAAYSRWK